MKHSALTVSIALVVLFFAAAWLFRDQIFVSTTTANTLPPSESKAAIEHATVLEISPQARKNIGLIAKPARPQSYWRSILIPGVVADRPGLSDRGVTSPAVGVVTAIQAFPGDTVRPGEPLFRLRLFSEYLQNTQTQLFTASQETQLIQAQIERLAGVASSGAVAKNRLTELQNELSRQNTLIRAARQDLLTRGLLPEQVQQVQRGEFVAEIEVAAPPSIKLTSHLTGSDAVESIRLMPTAQTTTADTAVETATTAETETASAKIAYEVQELSVELGQQVQAGQLLAKLSNHQLLYVVGHAFKREASFLEQAAQERRPVEVEFAEDTDHHWPELDRTLEIRHLANSIDAESRTFDFFVPLFNQSRTYEKEGETFLVWRFRPGQRTRIHVPVERYDNVFVLPTAAVVREGPEAYVFRQNGDLFKQLSVHVLHEDRRSMVIANDGSITPGSYLAQSAAATLNRVLKAQSASGEQPGVHVHPDGTVHAAH